MQIKYPERDELRTFVASRAVIARLVTVHLKWEPIRYYRNQSLSRNNYNETGEESRLPPEDERLTKGN